ncbi:MAG: PUA domain-containing protein [Candidatus Thorarchaeota archaeon]|jgi:ribosome biogenesis protein Nip4
MKYLLSGPSPEQVIAMDPELVDPIMWESIVKKIDSDFGSGTTRALMGNLIPVVMEHKDTKSFYLVPPEWAESVREGFTNFDIRLLGVWLGDLSKGRMRLSLPILEQLSKLTENIMIVSKHGAELFTYGRSILKEGVVSLKPSLKRGERVIVKDQQGNVLGLAMLVVDGFMRTRIGKEKLVAKNLVDIGWYIRRMA